MYFVGIIGDPGSGKTSLMTAILYDAHLEGTKIIANYKLEFPHALMSFRELAKLPASITRAHIGMDELGEGADSYDFFLSGPRRITKLVAQIRKRECKIYYTVQRFGMIAKRLRDLTQGFILMDDIDKQRPEHTIENCNSRFRMVFLNSDYRVMRRAIFNGKPYHKLYNTREIIWSYDVDDDQ